MSYTPPREGRQYDGHTTTGSSPVDPSVAGYQTPSTQFSHVPSKPKKTVRFADEAFIRLREASEDPFVSGPRAICDIQFPQLVPVVKNQAPVQPPFGHLGASSSKLSATASNFTPSSLAELNATSVPDFKNHHNGEKIRILREAYLASKAVGSNIQPPKFGLALASKNQAVLGHDKPLTNDLGVHHLIGAFTVDQKPGADPMASTRYVRLYGVAGFEMEDEAAAEGHLGHIKQSNLFAYVAGIKKIEDKKANRGEYLLRFDSLKHAKLVVEALKASKFSFNADWEIEFIDAGRYHRAANGTDTPYWSTNEAEIRLTVSWKDGEIKRVKNGLAILRQEVDNFISSVGTVTASCVELVNVNSNFMVLRVEMEAVTNADTLVRMVSRGFLFTSIVGGTSRMIGEHADTTHRPLGPGECEELMRKGRHAKDDHDNHNNMVIPEAITHGLDVRTTVMLRNIPNKLQSFEFKRMLDQCSAGKYDFFYLRVDFNNQCNVGYAFINFATPEDILPFYHMFANMGWNMYNTDKVAKICYATIQGKECLIERFRNSSVQTQWAPFRAKLFYTAIDRVPAEQIGTEMVFPEANNHSKLKRSLDNVVSVGLYPPRAMHKRVDRQRRSQFDRGTLSAIEEERAFDEAHRVNFFGGRALTYQHHGAVQPHQSGGYTPPFHPGPVAHYGGPFPHYGGPVAHYGGPVAHYGGPVAHYGGPIPQYGGPVPQYGGPVPQYGGPVPQRGGPVHGGPAPQYGGPVTPPVLGSPFVYVPRTYTYE